jgi:hypothetical protein
MPEDAMKALRQAMSPASARRSLAVAAIVGTALNAINQGDVWLVGGALDYWKMALTYLVPFCVATYGAWSMCLHNKQAVGPAGAGTWAEAEDRL